jgi:C4-dicarboxylate transporter, DctM subunit
MAFVGILFLAFVFLGIPIFVSLALTGLIGLWFTHGVPLAVIAAKTASASDSFVLLAIPLFLLAGSLMSNGGIAQRLFDLARALVGHVSGGLAQVNIALSVLNGGISGSSAADAALDSKVTIPQMQAQGYPAAFSGAITAASAMLSNIIPPSIAMLVYASISNTSVGKLFMAGIVPGLFMAAAMSITAHRTCRRLGYGPPSTQRAPWSQIALALRRSWIALSLPVIVVGGIRFGYFTPTEAGAIAVAIAFVLGTFVYRELRVRELPGILARTAIDTGVIMLIISFSAPVSLILAYNQVPQQVAGFFAGFDQSAAIFLLVVNIFLLLAGAVMEGVTLLVLVTPLLAPVAAALGIDATHFGMVVVFNVVLGSITPPFGQLVFMVSSMTGIRSEAMFREVLRYLPLLLVVLGVVTYLPQTFMWTVWMFGP